MTHLSLLEELGRESDLRNDAERKIFDELINDLIQRKNNGELSCSLRISLTILSQQANEHGSIIGNRILNVLSK